MKLKKMTTYEPALKQFKVLIDVLNSYYCSRLIFEWFPNYSATSSGCNRDCWLRRSRD